ncbi:D-2-hydroxyacid dehydrogenase [Hymenobacter psychrotolerans]|uniref:Phosphoglycerate dehydrogenase n=1 Tax=Hymenobacter psychrotolerans DSM 18569 TaxID=1121959 RepID=A0A1M6YF65_9BACT|nr:D-2-hydroxyacid dehydrogenase [Hymenobacter psychrotolerans]SHL16888.1 Phosphoglycerate dehydrogenase [Hymenobacter psychrotolerans DSM 18569]
MQLFVFTTLHDTARQLLRHQLPAEVQPVFRQELPSHNQQAAFQQADLVLGNPPADWFAAGPPPGLRFWQIDSAGIERYQHLDVGFPVANVGDYFAWPCAETIVAGILGWYRHIPELAVLQSRREWVGAPIRSRVGLLRDKRVIILGSGAIGQAVAEQLAGFRCDIRFLARTDPKAQLHSREELLAALPETDVAVNCLPGSAEKFFSAELVQAMPTHSLYASIGRGNTTDEPALIAALQAGRLAGAVLDVTAQEPLPAEHPFWQMPNVLLTQHSGGGQPREDEGKVEILLRNLRHLLQQEPLENLVTLKKGY